MTNLSKSATHNFARALRTYETTNRSLQKAKRMQGDLLDAFVEIGELSNAVYKAHASMRETFTTYQYVVHGLPPHISARMAI